MLPRCGHMIPLEYPQELADLVMAFREKHVQKEGILKSFKKKAVSGVANVGEILAEEQSGWKPCFIWSWMCMDSSMGGLFWKLKNKNRINSTVSWTSLRIWGIGGIVGLTTLTRQFITVASKNSSRKSNASCDNLSKVLEWEEQENTWINFTSHKRKSGENSWGRICWKC